VPADLPGEATETPSEREFDYDRTVALSDGVFAIALTLLILNVANPEGGTFSDRFSDVAPAIGAYALSFAVIAMLWMRHHALFRDMVRIDSRLTVLNLAYLGLIAFIPFPTGLISDQGDVPFSVVMYAGTMALSALLAAGVRRYALASGLLDPSSISAQEGLSRVLIVAGVFALSIPVAFVSTDAAKFVWLLLVAQRFYNPRG
jgi:uncharacterized membrane protein